LIFMEEGRIVEAGDARQVIAAPREARTAEFLASVI
jgi:polar amino acid transport system ATP-binding protein